MLKRHSALHMVITCLMVVGLLQQPMTVSGQSTTIHTTPQSEIYLPTITNDVVSVAGWPSTTPKELSAGGFGDRQNSWAWSMAWFKGKLYVGTNRNFNCVQASTIDSYFPDLGIYPPTDPDIPCPADKNDLDLRAEIWQYTLETNSWKRVFQSEEIDNPRAPGKKVARDIGFRSIAVYTQDGVEALYVGSLNAGEVIPELGVTHPPRILRSTDGETFTQIPGTAGKIDTIYGELYPNGFRAMQVLKGRLFATATSGLLGDGVVIEITDPAGPNPTFTQISPSTMPIYEMQVFDDHLYLGGGHPIDGYSVWKMDVASTPPYTLTPVVTNGAGRGATIVTVVSMAVYKGRLYVGSCGIQVITAPCELIRITPDHNWDVIVGHSRWTPQGFKFPLSGQPDGFFNPFNIHFWRMEEHDGALYLGTYDNSWWYRVVPWLDPFIKFLYGFDLFVSWDGVYWFQVTGNGFGQPSNVGVRNLVSTPAGLFLGSANDGDGAEVWLDPANIGAQAAGFTSPSALTTPDSYSPPRTPTRLEVESQLGANILSWDSSPGAVRYHILRSDYRLAKDLNADLPWTGPASWVPPVGNGESISPSTWIPGEYTGIDTTSALFFIDSTVKVGGRYAYQVQAEDEDGEMSMASNIALIPSSAPLVTFDHVTNAIRDLVERDQITAAGAVALLESLAKAQTAAAEDDHAGTVQALAQLYLQVSRNQGEVMKPFAVEDLKLLIAKLQRRASLVQIGVLSGSRLAQETTP